ncbi:MAG: tRNA (N(6)-L-threonylcarbamoyladenosine(37)-C(2))-methylthiotransferase MtaB [Gammaproteobacteria bacterium]|nr:tRNA (N(6)-L-threonylcarbamoyladenosine(37)-C(2))-methylthiotransferase MtaB [Gammaproteobacteria bacterium]
MRIHLSALGCRLNEAELEQWAQAFSRAGDSVTQQESDADVLVMNTCAVTSEAVRKSRQRIQKLQRQNPSAKLVVSGCYSSLEKPEVLAQLGVDLVVPNESKEQLVQMTRSAFEQPVMPENATTPAEAPLFQRNRHRAFIKIQDGCRYRCTFCIVTVARGAERSRSINDITDEVNSLASSGIKEVVLTGVHVGGYGSDLDTNLQALVSALLTNTDIPRIRFASVEPWDLSDEFLTLFEDPRLMPHMHLPLQSGSDTVLRRMARRCKTADFQELSHALQSSIPNFNITTDIIVGFPGETEQEWEESKQTIASLGFGHIHIFNYSIREGTKAATLPNHVPKSVRQSRSRELHQLANELRQQVLSTQLGQQVPVLWERGKKVCDGFEHAGYTPNYLKVITRSKENLANQILSTKLSGIQDSNLTGTIVPSL